MTPNLLRETLKTSVRAVKRKVDETLRPRPIKEIGEGAKNRAAKTWLEGGMRCK